ncbi:MAG: helix-turn-helix domain-containing protein [Gemmataceae bacterium]|nr:helix-turn-helix domain-containing protein [Gemmataceae bacterium]
MNTYLTVAQAAARACVSESLIYEACKAKRLVHFRPGINGRGKILILPEDVDRWMASFKVEAGQSTPPLKHITAR